jgi:putative hemolysin
MAYFEILLVVALTILNGLLAMSELAIASSRMPKLRALAEQRVAGAKRAMVLASDPGRFLSTVQIGITLIGIWRAFPGAALETVSFGSPGLDFRKPSRKPLAMASSSALSLISRSSSASLCPSRLPCAIPRGLPASWLPP